jgi:hypothetical protein
MAFLRAGVGIEENESPKTLAEWLVSTNLNSKKPKPARSSLNDQTKGHGGGSLI